MTDRTRLDPFEQRLASEFERLTIGATDAKPAIDIADAAMRPRGLPSTPAVQRNVRRLLLLGIAAVMAISSAYAAGLGGQQKAHTPSESSSAFGPDQTHGPSYEPVRTPQPDGSPQSGLRYSAVVLRRTAGTPPGISAYSVSPDGSEAFVRTVPDSVLPPGHKLAGDGAVSRDGWLRLEDTGGLPGVKDVVVVDLGDPQSAMWIVPESYGCCPTPEWGPSGLLASESIDQPSTVLTIADPLSRTTQPLSLSGDLANMRGSIVPDILWTMDGGILEGVGGRFMTRYVDGRADSIGFPALYSLTSIFGAAGSTLTVCSVDRNPCPVNASPGGARLLTADGVSQNVYTPAAGEDRVLAAAFGRQPGHYWLLLDHGGGQVRVVESTVVSLRDVASITHQGTGDSFSFGDSAPDESMLAIWAPGQGGPSVVLVPTGGGSASVHAGQFAGWMTTRSSASSP